MWLTPELTAQMADERAVLRLVPTLSFVTATALFPIATKHRLWLKVLVGGLILWAPTVAVLWALR
jgi:hypothetical protein